MQEAHAARSCCTIVGLNWHGMLCMVPVSRIFGGQLDGGYCVHHSIEQLGDIAGGCCAGVGSDAAYLMRVELHKRKPLAHPFLFVHGHVEPACARKWVHLLHAHGTCMHTIDQRQDTTGCHLTFSYPHSHLADDLLDHAGQLVELLRRHLWQVVQDCAAAQNFKSWLLLHLASHARTNQGLS